MFCHFYLKTLCLGDVISIFADGAGFISTLGLVDDRCVTNVDAGSLQR
jgi:hypothetical protein